MKSPGSESFSEPLPFSKDKLRDAVLAVVANS